MHLDEMTDNSSARPPLNRGKDTPETHRGPSRRQVSHRRGHFKSRLGCHSCKRRRVKCDEVHPVCSGCRRLDLRCEYPSTVAGISHATRALSMASSPAIQAPLASLTLQDLRFYHQFLTVARPTIPLKSEDLWMQCAAMSHEYDFLAHAVLGLGAAHITQSTPGLDYTTEALQHRVTTMQRVNERLSLPSLSPQEADALLAAVLCLVSQSSLLPDLDGMADYLTMSRGGSLIANSLIKEIATSLFRAHQEEHFEILSSMVQEQPKNQSMITGFRASGLALRPLAANENERNYADALIRCIDAVEISGIEGKFLRKLCARYETNLLPAWKRFLDVFMMAISFSHEDFSAFVSPDNHVARLLMIHTFLVEYVLGQVCIAPTEAPSTPGRKNVIIAWTRQVAAALPTEMKSYVDWPLEFANLLETLDSRYLWSP
ncbi:unnamed protein product [Clonostachys chloroleuca]|uniref:Zn(2)-C6 fungal-type domain-containing protein n=1 Tax=Clonostachys chloroleuca TaxID=1926264 RepID=A0AA35PXM0_9HYPO|nr:unnamed protein product [Clonostachys chloroleuca]